MPNAIRDLSSIQPLKSPEEDVEDEEEENFEIPEPREESRADKIRRILEETEHDGRGSSLIDYSGGRVVQVALSREDKRVIEAVCRLYSIPPSTFLRSTTLKYARDVLNMYDLELIDKRRGLSDD